MTYIFLKSIAELFATSKQTISHHIVNILKDRELDDFSVVKQYLTTAADGKNYNVVFYSLEMVIAVGYRVRADRVCSHSKKRTSFKVAAPTLFQTDEQQAIKLLFDLKLYLSDVF